MRRAERWLVSALLLGAACFSQPVEYDNTASRFLALSSVVDYGRLDIDRFHERTIDKAYSGGHYYPLKGIGTLLVATPVYWALRKTLLPRLEGVPEPALLHEAHARFLVRVITTTLPFALVGLWMFRALARLVPARSAFLASAAYGVGSIALNHATIFSGHQLTGCLLFAAFLLLRAPPSPGSGPPKPAAALAAGALCGLAVLVEFPAALAAGVLAAYVAASRATRPAAKAAFVAGAAVFAAVLFAYNRACFGSALTFSYAVQSHPKFAEHAARGLVGITLPDAGALAGLLLSPARGLFFIMPVFLYALVGLRRMWRWGFRADAAVVASIAGSTTLLISAYAVWHGGWTFGPRHLVYTLPFLAWATAWAADSRPAFLFLLALSSLQVLGAQLGVPHAPERVVNPLLELILPLIRRGYTASTLLDATGWGAVLAGGLIWLGLAAALPATLRALPGPSPAAAPPAAERWLAGWGACVVLALALARTPDPELVRCYRGVLLADAATELDSEPLLREARLEWAAAGGAARCGPGRSGL